MIRRILAVMRKEYTQMLRDRRTLGLQLSIPIILLFLNGYAIEVQVDHIPTVVVDHSRDQTSWSLLQAMENSTFFDISYYVESEREAIAAIDAGEARAAIVIPPDFGSTVERGGAQALIILDGSDTLTLQSAYGAAIPIAQEYSAKIMTQKLERTVPGVVEAQLVPVDIRTSVLYNPDMKTIVFMVPAIVSLILQNQAMSLVALAVVKEREGGTMEQLLVTPIRPLELMIGKLAPNLSMSFINMLTVLSLGIFWFKVPFNGSITLFLWLSLLYMVSALGLGILISTVSSSQQQASQLTLFLLVPTLVLSGYIFPREALPRFVRFVGEFLPMTHFLGIARGIITKGVGLEFVWDQVIALAIFGVVMLILSSGAFKQRLE